MRIFKSSFNFEPEKYGDGWSVWVHHPLGFEPSVGWIQVNSGKWEYQSSVGSMGHQQRWFTTDPSAIEDWNMAHAEEKYQEIPSI